MTEWKWRIYLFVRAVDATLANKQAFAQIYVDGGTGETLENETKLLDVVTGFSQTGQPPAQAYGLNLTAKTGMRDAFVNFLDGLTNAGYAVVANTDLPNFAEGELVATNFPVSPNGQIVSWEMAKQYLFDQYGLIEILPEEPTDESL